MTADLESTIAWIRDSLARDDAVKGLVLIGSCARSDVVRDEWSDVDLAVVVDDGSMRRFHPTMDWAREFGELYAHDVSRTEHFRVLRAQYADGRRADFVIIPESSLSAIDDWELNPLQFGSRCLLSRSSLLDAVLRRPAQPRIVKQSAPDDLETLSNKFWFKGMLAVGKAARNELLVASHLALDMARDCLVLAMLIRDRDTGTDHHRDGSEGNRLVEMAGRPCSNYTAAEILESIERSAVAFDALAARLHGSYVERRGPLIERVGKARDKL